MSERRDVSRQVGIFTYTQFFVRQMLPDGRVCCVYCGEELGPGNRCLDHWNNKAHDNRPENLLAACLDCNAAIGSHDDEGWERICDRVAELGGDAHDIEPRVIAFLREPLPDKADPRVQALAWGWFGPRITEQRALAAKRSGREPQPTLYHHGDDERHDIPF